MTKHDISTPEELDTALSANALRRHDQLWKVAEGRSIRLVEALGLVSAVLLVAIGVVTGFSQNAVGAVQLALGVLLIGSFIWTHMQRQVNALAELVKKLEREQSSISRGA